MDQRADTGTGGGAKRASARAAGGVARWFALAAALAATGAARAAEPTPVVMLAHQSDEMTSLGAAKEVASQLADLPVRFDVEWVGAPAPDLRTQVELAGGAAAARGAAAVFWADFTAADRVFVYIAEPSGGRILVRGLAAEEQSTEARLMTLAVIVRGAVKAILAGGRIGVRAPAGPAPALAEPEPPAAALDGCIAYAPQLFSTREPVLHGARLEISARLAGWLRAYAAYRLNIPPRVRRADVVVDLLTCPAEIGLAARGATAPWRVEGGIGARVTVVDLNITSLDAELAPASDTLRVEAAVVPWLGVARRVGPVASFFLRASVDVVVNRHRYVVETEDRTITVLRPWRLRPSASIGATFAIL